MSYVNLYIRNLQRVKFHESRRNVLRLDMNESPTGLPEAFVEAVKQKITPALLAMYPEKDALQKLLAKHLGRKEEEISITAGADEAMRLVFQCFGEPGRTMLAAAPTFEMYGVYAKMFGMQQISAQYDANLMLPIEALVERIAGGVSLVAVLNPDSPIGTRRSKAELEHVLATAKAHGAIVILDETYSGFGEVQSGLDLIDKYENLLVLRTFSKLWALAGLRIGYAVGSSALIHYLENASSTFNVNSIALLFAEALLRRPQIVEQMQQSEAAGHAWLAEKMRKADYPVRSEGGNYLLFRPRRDSTRLVVALKEKGVWIRDYSRGAVKGWARVTTGERALMERFWHALWELDGEESGT